MKLKPSSTEPQKPTTGVPVGASAYDEDGVDVGLIRWMLSLTPTERLQALQSFVDFVESATGVEDAH